MKLNENYFRLGNNYLFAEIAARVKEYNLTEHKLPLIRLGIGDVTLPLCKSVIKAMNNAVAEMGEASTFHGYAPDYGYAFLLNAIRDYYKNKHSVEINTDEIFVSDGAKSDVGNITEIFGDNTVLIPDPVYPVYLDSNIMAGRNIKFISANIKNSFLPMPSDIEEGIVPDIIYMCSPNNPTGAVYSFEQLSKWVDYANEHSALILFDAAYEGFITESDKPCSIYQIEGAKRCAVEFCSFSKLAGFTGTRCAYTVIPNELKVGEHKLNSLWKRRQSTKLNGVSYIVQRGAAAALSEEGLKEISSNIKYYLNNANVLAEALKSKGIEFTGGVNSPYIWFKCPNGADSWKYFDYLLNEYAIVGTPGAGFGREGEGYFRLTGFGSAEATKQAAERLV